MSYSTEKSGFHIVININQSIKVNFFCLLFFFFFSGNVQKETRKDMDKNSIQPGSKYFLDAVVGQETFATSCNRAYLVVNILGNTPSNYWAGNSRTQVVIDLWIKTSMENIDFHT